MLTAIEIFIIMISVFFDALRDKKMPDLYKYKGIIELLLCWDNWTKDQKLWHIYKWISVFSMWIMSIVLLFITMNYEFPKIQNIYKIIYIIILSIACKVIWKLIYK